MPKVCENFKTKVTTYVVEGDTLGDTYLMI